MVPVSALSVLQPQTDSDNVRLARALADLSSGRPFEAVQGLMEIVRNGDSTGAAHFYLAVVYTDLGELARARDFAERAVAIDPGEGKFRYQLGVVLERSDDRVAARDALDEAIRLGMDGDEGTAWRELGEVFVLLLERDRARRAFETAVESAPRDPRNRLAMGRFLLDEGEGHAAAVHLRVAAAVDPRLDGVLANLGVALRRTGDTNGALAVLRRGVALNSADQRARYALAQSLVEAGQTEEAQAQLEEYRKLDTRISNANGALAEGLLQLEAGHIAEARRLLEEAVALAPNYSAAHESLGRALLAARQSEAAVSSLERAVALNPLNAGAYFSLGAALREAGRLEEAVDAARRSTVLDCSEPVYLEQLGEILLALDRNGEARDAFDRATRARQIP